MNENLVFKVILSIFGVMVLVFILSLCTITYVVSTYESPYKGKCELTEKFPQKKLAAYRCADGVIYWETY